MKTVPAAGSDDVDPKLTEIKVTFSKDMQDESWSWSGLSTESFPKMDGKPKYLADTPRFLAYARPVAKRYRELAPLGRLLEAIPDVVQ